jgi:hypothetical protein
VTAGNDLGVVERQATRRRENGAKAAAPSPATDAQGLVEFACECRQAECERSVKVPLYVYRRLAEADDQYLVQAGHHAFERYRTLVVKGSMRIEERRV